MSQKFFENKEEITLLFKSLENSYDGILALDIDYKILYANSAIKKIFGFPLRDLIGNSAEIILTKNYLKQIKGKIQKNKTWEGEFCIKQKKGKDLFVWIKAILVKNKIPFRIILLFQDIHEWKKMESDLKNYAVKVEESFRIMEEEKLKSETIFSSIAEGLFTVDNNWIITSFNPSAEKITGIKSNYAIGKPCHKIIHGELCKKHECALSKSKKTGRVMLNIEGKIRDSTGYWLPVIISTAPLRNPQNEITGGVETFRDVSELEKVNQELVKLNNIKTDFLSMVSHELKTPLTIIKGYSELLAHGKFGSLLPHQKEVINMIRSKVDKLNFLINDLLDISQLEFGKFKINKQLFSLTELFTNKKEEFKIIAENKNIILNFNSCAEEIIFNGDKERISQVLSNLISNAVKFTNPGGQIKVNMENGSNFIHINVIDSGIGMKQEETENIFDKFYQIDTSNTRQYSGVGLGLAISKDIIEMHGGKINVKSEPGCGSTFTVVLPYKITN